MPDEFPKVLYRAGDAIEWEGRTFDILIVASADEEAAAEGWLTAADILKPKKKGQ